MESEKTYQIYGVLARWIEKEGMSNGTSFNVMYRDETSIEQARQEAMKWWDDYSTGKMKDKEPELTELRVYFKEREVWCLKWFNHFTYDEGQDDRELLDSFERFVERKQRQNVENGHFPTQVNTRLGYKNFYVLMGAEDRWRRKGPCRCEHCKKRGVVYIDH